MNSPCCSAKLIKINVGHGGPDRVFKQVYECSNCHERMTVYRVCMHNPPDDDTPCKEKHPLIDINAVYKFKKITKATCICDPKPKKFYPHEMCGYIPRDCQHDLMTVDDDSSRTGRSEVCKKECGYSKEI